MAQQLKLAPPIIENKIAAQAENQGLQTITVPFSMNRAVGWSQFFSIKILIKTVQSSTIIKITNDECKKENLVFKDGKYWATFVTGDVFTVGQSYKIQLAYTGITNDGIPNNYVGHYSSVGVFKFTTSPEVYIENLNGSNVNVHLDNYIGVYKNSDQSERVYSYQFNLYNENGEQVASSGECLHNSSKDVQVTSSSDEWNIDYILNDTQIYTLVYKITTNNGLECSSQPYRIYQGVTFNSTMSQYCDLIAEKNQDEAFIDLSLRPNNDEKKYINGKFLLLRASSEDNFGTWQKLTTFILSTHDTSQIFYICRDYCLAQGVSYKYAIQAYNEKGVYANRQISKPEIIFMDFEDMFLGDGDRQLKIRFNPKVTSFKNTLLESKTDTLGSKYPFFFRNGNTNYKEFPISGLISMLMDDTGAFINGLSAVDDYQKNVIVSSPHNLTGEVIFQEREFKMAVLQWLNNGKPKLFRSPTEGNYIVRLMNTSLSPNDTLGRMLHTFSSTAYEIDDYNFINLKKHNLWKSDAVDNSELTFKIIQLDKDEKYNGKLQNLNAYSAMIEAKPGTVFQYNLKYDLSWSQITIGTSGVYIFDSSVLSENPLMSVTPPVQSRIQSKNYWGDNTIFSYSSYEKTNLESFTKIDSVQISDCIRRLNGQKDSLIKQITDENQIITSIGKIYYLRVNPRPIIPISQADWDINSKIYKFRRNNVAYTPTPEVLLRLDSGNSTVYYDGYTRQLIEGNIDFKFKFGDNEIDMSGSTPQLGELTQNLKLENYINLLKETDEGLILNNIDNSQISFDNDKDSFYLGNGLYADIAYQEIKRTYTIETVLGNEINTLKQDWEKYHQPKDYEAYYKALLEWYNTIGEENIIDAI